MPADQYACQGAQRGMNTLGNWTDGNILGTTGMPYVTSLTHFPRTEQTIFRDFPDVFSEEYANNAKESAKALEACKVDPLTSGNDREFHFGALDAGPSPTGLEGVADQKERGVAYRYYCERVAVHPYGVGIGYTLYTVTYRI